MNNAVGFVRSAAQVAYDVVDPCMGAQTAVGCTFVVGATAVVGRAGGAAVGVVVREVRGKKVFTDKAGAAVIDGGGDFFRGARAGEEVSFIPRPGEYKVDTSAGFVKSTHGVSIFDNPQSLVDKGLEPHKIDLNSVPDSLRIIQRGKDPRHFEITPAPDTNLTPEEFINACSQISCKK